MTDRMVSFTKMQGAGNDYIYVNTMLYDIPNPVTEAIKWSNRHTGIGSDGLVLIGRPTNTEQADYSMRIFNADGSEAMMCGNASRCIGKYLFEKGLTDKTDIRLETLSGVKTLHLDVADGKVNNVTVDMLEPSFHNPKQYDEALPVMLPDGLDAIHATFVSMGNPHYVLFVNDVEQLPVDKFGNLLEFHPAFPERCNIEFVQVIGPDSLRARVWERGSGITMACGTGACATAVAASLLGLTPRSADVQMDGGILHIDWNQDDNHVYLSGPAEFVFEGEIAI